MKATTLIKVAGKSMLKNKARTFLTMLGIIIGVGAVIMMVAIGAGAQRQVEKQIRGLGTNMIVVTPGTSNQGGVSQGAGSFSRLTFKDAETMRSQCFLLSAVSPVVDTRTQAIGGQGNWRTWIFGVDTDYLAIRDWQLESGVFFNDSDVRALRKVAVLGKTVAENLFPYEDPVGAQIQLRNVPFTIVGVLARKGQTAGGSDQDDAVYAPYTTVYNRLSGHVHIHQILAGTSTPEDIPAAEEEIRQVLRETHGLGTNEDDDFTIMNQTDLVEAAQGTTRVMRLLLFAIASISLLVGGIGIMNIMLVSVTERTREIGLRLALGARGSDVLTQFLVESVVMSIVGGLIGIGVGFGGSALLSVLAGWQTSVSMPTVFLALAFAAGVGIFFGYYPARRAAALDPIEALRYE
jgi:putative ABC transport system permease protein